jgi:hypothetical protein
MWICNNIVEIIIRCTSSTRVNRILPRTSSSYVPTLCHTSFSTLPLVVCQIFSIFSMRHVYINESICSTNSPFVIDGNSIIELLPLSMCSYGINSPLLYDPLCHSCILFFSPFDINGKWIFPINFTHPESESLCLKVVFPAAQFLVLLPLRLNRYFSSLQTSMNVMCINEGWEGLHDFSLRYSKESLGNGLI